MKIELLINYVSGQARLNSELSKLYDNSGAHELASIHASHAVMNVAILEILNQQLNLKECTDVDD